MHFYRLFHSRINDATSQGRPTFDAKEDFSLIPLVYNNGDEPSDLIGCLTNQMFPERGPLGTNHTTAGGCVTIEPADVIAFALARDESLPSPAVGRPQQRGKFSFPESFHLDQFVMASRSHAWNANVAEGGVLRKLGYDLMRVSVNGIHLPSPSECLLASQNKDFMKSTLSSLHYYENVARSPTDIERRAAIESSAAKLKNVIAHIDAEWNGELRNGSRGSRPTKWISSDWYHGRAVQSGVTELALVEASPAKQGNVPLRAVGGCWHANG